MRCWGPPSQVSFGPKSAGQVTTFYKWKSKYGGMEASDVLRMKELEAENRKLKQMFAELSLENTMLKDVIEKKL